MKFLILISRLFLLFFFLACVNFSDNNIKLGDGYYIRQEGKLNNSVRGPINIFENIDSFYIGSEYILVHQIPMYDSYKSILIGELHVLFASKGEYKSNLFDSHQAYLILKKLSFAGKNDMNDRKILNIFSDSILNNTTYYKNILTPKENYWIINKPAAQLIGPLNRKTFYDNLDSVQLDKKLKPVN